MANNEEQAVLTYFLRKNRYDHPEGNSDNGGRWYPSEYEWQQCCNSIRSPSIDPIHGV